MVLSVDCSTLSFHCMAKLSIEHYSLSCHKFPCNLILRLLEAISLQADFSCLTAEIRLASTRICAGTEKPELLAPGPRCGYDREWIG